MSDPDGNWPKFIKEAWNRVKYVAKMIVKTVTAPFKAAKVSAGAGIGIGAKGSVTVKGAKAEVGATASITDSVVYDKGKIDIRNTASVKANVTFGNIADFSIGSGKEHSFFDEKCNCNILHDPFVQQMNCVASSKIQPVEATLGFSVGLYLLLGGEISVGVDLKVLHDELIGVFTEPYVSTY